MKHLCIDRILPQDMFRAHRSENVRGQIRAITPIGKQWVNGQTLKVRFIGGTQEKHIMVAATAQEWMNSCNLKFEFNNANDAEIRIAFDEGDGSWSYIGTDAKFVPADSPTMNFGWLDRAVILHEFGHCIGFGHEHQNPEGGIEWNAQEVVRDLSGAPNWWDEATILHNVLRKYSTDQIRGTLFDSHSIMLYPFPSSWTRNGIGTQMNTQLSAIDKHFVSTVMYPEIHPQATILSPLAWFRTKAQIIRPGQEDLYKFIAHVDGRYQINTTGDSDMFIRLYGPRSIRNIIAEDDNSGTRTNAQLFQNLSKGEYWIQVRHTNVLEGVGKYTIKVRLLQ